MFPLILVALFAFISIFLLGQFLFGAPYVPSRSAQVQALVELSGVRPGEKAVDLGSGDGRIVEAFARVGAEAHGYEINPLLVWASRQRLRAAGLSEKAFIHWKSFWPIDLSSMDIVVFFGTRHMLDQLSEKLRRELKPGARIVSNGYKLPGWTVERSLNRAHLFSKAAS